MQESHIEFAASNAIGLTKLRGLVEVGSDELLLGAMLAVSRFGVVRFGAALIDLEQHGVDWLQQEGTRGAKVGYSAAAIALFDRAARVAKADGAATIGVEHLLAAFAVQEGGLVLEMKQRYGLSSAGWRAAAAELAQTLVALRTGEAAPEVLRPQAGVRDYLTPEEAAEALGIHVQTLRGYVRSGKLPALRLAGERALRIRRMDLEQVLEPVVETSGSQAAIPN